MGAGNVTEHLPALLYAGTSGFAATSDTSREATESLDAGGVTEHRQRVAMQMLTEAGRDGVTARELARSLGIEFHRAAPPLSLLHKAGLVSRVKERRERYEVYVRHEFVDGRELSPPSHHGYSAADLNAAFAAGVTCGAADGPDFDRWLAEHQPVRSGR
jgi:hypothetical protein